MWAAIGAAMSTAILYCGGEVIWPRIRPQLEKLSENCFSWLGELVGHMYNLQKNLDLLSKALEDLIAERDDVERRVKDEQLKGGREPLAVVRNWLRDVQTIETYTNQLIHEASSQDTSSQASSSQDTSSQVASGQDASCQASSSQDTSSVPQPLATVGCFSVDNVSTLSIGERVFNKLEEIRVLSSKGKLFSEVTGQALLPVVEVRNEGTTFGLDMILKKTLESLKDDKNSILSIWGMGGIGKTTLLTRINNKCADAFKGYFDIVIWVEVSKVVDIGKIQDDIGERLGLYTGKWSQKTESEKAGDIFRFLSKEKPRFLLLLDDLWETLNLPRIGIPIPIVGIRRRVLFTTRLLDVSGAMGAQVEIEATFLAEEDAEELFLKTVRGHMLDEELKALATEIGKKCRRLPLALTVIGGIMSSKWRSEFGWRSALETVNSSLSELDQGVEEKLFLVLKFSYDHLEGGDAKSCCRYWALFPEAYNVRQDEVVEYWMGEGIIDTKVRGYEILESLVGASLLVKDGESVRMHDLIREMALLITKSEAEEEFFVKTGAGLTEQPEGVEWKTVTKMSLMNNDIKSIHADPVFPNPALLITLFLQNNKLVQIAGEFFTVMSTLKVLDLSSNRSITTLPEEISNLVSLRYLSLLGTRIKYLPDGFGTLGKLIHLDLESTSDLESIGLVSGLLNLQVLRFYGSSAALDISLLEQLERLQYLKSLTISVRDADVLEAFLGSRLARKTQGLYLEGLTVSVASFAATFGALESLGNLKMTNCDIIESDAEWEDNRKNQYSPSTSSNLFQKLSAVVLNSCSNLKDLSWLRYATNLVSLTITVLPNLEEVISKKKAASEPSFEKLQVLDLDFLNALKCVYWRRLKLPKLQKVYITNCQNLPLDSICETQFDPLTRRF